MPNFKILHPSFVFNAVHKRTGSIERNCIFSNPLPSALKLHVGFDFPEHSWVQIYGPAEDRRQFSFINGQPLTLEPGDNPVLISLNTDNFNFPERRFRGRICFREESDETSKDWIEIHFEDVEELQPFAGFAAIDLGTSSTAVSLYHLQKDAMRLPWTPEIDGQETCIAAAQFIRNFQKFSRHAEGGCLTGSNALRAYRKAAPRDPRCLVLGIKRLIGRERVLVTDEKGSGGHVASDDLLVEYLKFVREQAQNHPLVRSRLQRISVTYPPTWSYQKISRLREAFRKLGFADEDLDFSLDEASAAGLYSIYRWMREKDSLRRLIQDLLETETEAQHQGKRGKRYTLNLLSCDFGGGSMDLSFIEAQIELYREAVRLRLGQLGSSSEDFGGDQVTLAMFRMLKRRLALTLADPRRMFRERGAAPEAERAQEEAAAPERPGAMPPQLRGMKPFRRGRENTFLLPGGGAPGFDGFIPEEHEAALDPARRTLRRRWEEAAGRIGSPGLDAEIENAVDELFPTRFLPGADELYRPEARRNFDWLWTEAEALKRRLFEETERRLGSGDFPPFERLAEIRCGMPVRRVPEGSAAAGIPWPDETAAERILSVSAAEVFQAIQPRLQEAFARARRLVQGKKIDRVVFSGESSRMPMARWMISRPGHEGGFGIPPAKVEFEAGDAKAAVSRGACLLQVLRDATVGFEVDIADFKAHLAADIFYMQVDGERRTLFASGPIEDLQPFEARPEIRDFPRYLSIFHGAAGNLLGQFHFGEEGEELPPYPPRAAGGAAEPLPPGREELLRLRVSDRAAYARWLAAVSRWPEKKRLAWLESTASPGTPAQPAYRFYLNRNHGLFAVRDPGKGGKRLFAFHPYEAASAEHPDADPFSGAH